MNSGWQQPVLSSNLLSIAWNTVWCLAWRSASISCPSLPLLQGRHRGTGCGLHQLHLRLPRHRGPGAAGGRWVQLGCQQGWLQQNGLAERCSMPLCMLAQRWLPCHKSLAYLAYHTALPCRRRRRCCMPWQASCRGSCWGKAARRPRWRAGPTPVTAWPQRAGRAAGAAAGVRAGEMPVGPCRAPAGRPLPGALCALCCLAWRWRMRLRQPALPPPSAGRPSARRPPRALRQPLCRT